MRFFFCLILLSCIFAEYSLAINNTNLIQCTSDCSTITISFAQAQVFPQECQANNNDYALACGIDYRLDYDKEEITIEFHATNDTGTLGDQKPSEFVVQTIWLALSNTTSEPNALLRKYGCNTHNDCARKSYLNSINYFINEGRSQLESFKSKLPNDSLIVGEDSKRRCIDSRRNGPKPAVKCPTGLCYLDVQQFHLHEAQNFKEQRCDEENRPMFFSEIERHTPSSAEKDRDFLKYRCNKNVCNRDDFVERIKDLVTDFTTKAASIPSEKSATGKNGASSLPQTASSSLLILFLLQFFI